MERPAILLLDEPFNGLDKHGARDIEVLCGRVYEMDGGKLEQVR